MAWFERVWYTGTRRKMNPLVYCRAGNGDLSWAGLVMSMEHANQGAEKRRARRFPMALPVALMRPGETTEEPVQTRDISSGGIYFQMAEAPQPGSRMEFILTLPSEITLTGPVQIRCFGKVLRVDRGGSRQIGVAATIERYEFLRMAPGKVTVPSA